MSEASKPWEEKGSIWKSKSAYYSWLRGQIRRIWSRYPVKNEFINSRVIMRKVGVFKTGKRKGQDKMQKFAICDRCEQEMPVGKLEVDHITPAGSLKSEQDLEGFITRLLCSFENMRHLCKEHCHPIITYTQKHECSEEEAEMMIEVNAIEKKGIAHVKKILKENSVAEADMSNSQKRREQLIKIIK